MYVKIKNHDPAKRYIFKIASGGVEKTTYVPEGFRMPLTWRNKGSNPSPLRSGKAVGFVGVQGCEMHHFSFDLKEDEYFYADDHVVISS